MKLNFLPLVITILFFVNSSLGQNIEVTHQANGTTLSVPIQSIDSVVFQLSPPPTMKNIYQNNGNILGIAMDDVDSITYIVPNPSILPQVTTSSTIVMSSSSSSSGGDVTGDGGSPVTQRGVCWNIFPNPTIANNFSQNGSGLGVFNHIVQPLLPTTTYYIRAYATNINGTAYGNEVSFTTSAANTSGGLPVVTTTQYNQYSDVGYIDGYTAISGGEITGDGGLAITARGVCWAIGSTPTINNATTNDGAGAGTYTSILTNLQANTNYFVRAYATNDAGTAYGITYNFTTNNYAEVVTDTFDFTTINSDSVDVSGVLIDDGGSPVTQFGICWSLSSSPTILDSVIVLGQDSWGVPLGSFTGTVRAIDFDVSNYYRAYGMNSMGVSYGSVEIFEILGGNIQSIDCVGATLNGTLLEGVAANAVTAEFVYTGGDGGPYNSQTVTSSVVTGLSAELASGGFATGTGTLIYDITGTPNSIGTANFLIEIGGESCLLEISVDENLYPTGTIHCGNPTVVADVTNPSTGKTWMDRDLGASQVAVSITDQNAYGDLYQWGRRSDGHQCRTSSSTSLLSSSDQPVHGEFIWAPNTPYDWRSPQNSNLWQGVNGVNTPCPNGYRLPSEAELTAEVQSWSSENNIGAFASPLKLPSGGYRDSNTSLSNVDEYGVYWSSTVNGGNSCSILLTNFYVTIDSNAPRAHGYSVRCIKD